MFPTHINIIIITLWLMAATVDYIQYLYYWQLKWYMWSRYRDFLNSKQGSEFVLRKSFLLRAGVALTIYIISLDNILFLKYFIISFFLADLIFLFGYRFLRKKFRRPIITSKVLIILGLALTIEASILFTSHNWDHVMLFLLIRIIIISLSAIIIDNITTLVKNHYYSRRAEKKLKRFPQLKIIGITGSYGKTTTKELLAQMLETKFRVVKTPKNTNSDIGVSQFILKTNFENVDIFIVEMGAYVKGDIKLHCNIAHPHIGILTAINPQHLSLFGNITAIQETKYELLRCLPKDGLAVVNSDNPYCREFLGQIRAEVVTFGTEEEYKPTLLIEDLKQTKEGLYSKGTVLWGGEIFSAGVQTQLTGEHMMMNVAPAILVARFLGFDHEEILDSVSSLKNPENALQIYQYGEATIIDDSYNSNPDGFRAALQILNTFSSDRKRIVVTRGMLELGDESDELHEQIGGEIAFVADELCIITPDFVEPLKRGVVQKYNTEIITKLNPEDLLHYLKDYKDKDVVILIENRIPSLIRKELFKTK